MLESVDDDDDEDLDDMDNEMLKDANFFIPHSATTNNDDIIINSHSNSEFSQMDQYSTNTAQFSHIDHTDVSSSFSSSTNRQQVEQFNHQSPENAFQSQEKGDNRVIENDGKAASRSSSRSNNNKQHHEHVAMSELGSTRTQPVGADAQNDNLTNKGEEHHVVKPSRVFKVVIIGDSSVGKSTFLHRFCHQEFKSNFNATIGVDFQIKTLNFPDSTVILQLWDTAGQERFRSMTKTYFRKADGVIIMYDVTSEKTFMGVRNWMISVQEQVEPGTVLALLGNKQDISPDDGHRPVKTRDGLALALDYDAIFFETSAKSGLNVEESMEKMAKLLQEKEDKKLEEGLSLSDGKAGGKKKCCG